MPLCATMYLLMMSAGSTSGLPEIMGGRSWVSVHMDKYAVSGDQRERNVTVALAVSPLNCLVFHSTYIGGMNAPRFNDFLAWTRQNLNPDEEVTFVRDGGPAHRNPAIPCNQYHAGDAPALQPVPEHSGAGNQLTESSYKRRRIEARNTGSNG